MTSPRGPLGQQGTPELRSDGGPEQRWRRTLDLRKRPATLPVRRLLQDFGHSELSPAVAQAIEAQLATVNLTVEPSLSAASIGDSVAIRRGVRAPARAPTVPPGRAPGTDKDHNARESPSQTGATERITALERELAGARLQVERLQAELEALSMAKHAAGATAHQTFSQDGTVGAEQRRELAQLSDILYQTHCDVTSIRRDIRHCTASLDVL